MRAGSRAASHACVWGLITIFVIAAATPADARRHTRGTRSHSSSSSSYSPPYSAIVVDANSGATLHESSPDGVRHPASLTKIMTLYMLFEQLDAGKLTLESQITVSEHAADQSPTKLGVPAGGSIRVEDAIKAIVTRSANDIACAVGEALGGDEETFARMMTKKARALGMSRTTYRNASGLPDDEQVTSARDQAILGRAIQERFPRYYRYFSTRSFTYRGQRIGNHNHLLGSVEGVDGIKTGYVRASGFNLVTSIRRGGRHLVAVVMGGKSGSARDARMRDLVSQYISKGSTQRTVAMIGEGNASTRAAARTAPAPDVSLARTAEAPFTTAAAPPAPPQEPAAKPPTPRRAADTNVAMLAPTVGSSDEIKPIPVRTLRVRATTLKATAIGDTSEPARAAPQPEADAMRTPARPVAEAPRQPVAAAVALAPVAQAPAPATAPPATFSVAAATPQPASVPAQPAPKPAPVIAAAPPPVVTPAAPAVIAPTPAVAAAPSPPAMPQQVAASEKTATVATIAVEEAPDVKPATRGSKLRAAAAEAAPPEAERTSNESSSAAARAQARDGWLIQVGALESMTQAKERLGSAQSSAAKLLKQADPFTEKVVKGERTFYRARFAGLDKNQAEAACRALKHNDIPCILVAGTRN
jgi:D-alanyl-D-alanine carboxypeptidase